MNSPTNTLSTDENRKLMSEIQIYEKRIQGLIDGIGMLKDRVSFKKFYSLILLVNIDASSC
jgi:hypothetical protein